ncbi:MAG: indole-3-glycerol phosphate synthase TrpC [Candidatus Omnitrophica bacterium]|nr:indole-3-glycerol phosphate synthase TrpC [Candidatus Omnitrophota bacterium]MDE2223175.1 indole-3-glycerol phosphate synthase TrpC [Candidatus Omnitrophota bacterium]
MARHKLESLTARKDYYENLVKNMKSPEGRRYQVFKKAVSKPGGVNLIAEIKKASPSAGLIREDFNAEAIAQIYIDNKAAAISVLTEDKYFLGKFAYLAQVSRQATVPVLMKDFIVHEYQIYEGLFNGASAVLLIVAMLPNKKLTDLIRLTHQLGLDCLVEVHDEIEVERALACGAEIIGVNNRNLQTLQVDLNNCLKLIPLIPKDVVIVAESGLKTHDDVLRVEQAGANAVLIGETFMRSPDIGAKVKEVMYGTR